jgi:diadenosine tetraphosphatase ApaH/serine/threonine PP2A family protein phosphatase
MSEDAKPDATTPAGIRQWIAGNIWGPVPESHVVRVLIRFMEVINQENNVLLVASPIYVVGDIHGQLDDLLFLFGRVDALPVGAPRAHGRDLFTRPLAFDASKRFLFMGDYVDRGYHSLNTFLYLLCLKLEYPQAIYLLRGNHESRQISNRYGFYHECVLNYGHAGLWMLCMEAFDLLPMGALVDQDVFCVHGGLSPKLPMLEKISLLDRQQEIPQQGPLADLCWSDPENVGSWRENTRGAGYLFGRNETMKFTRINRLDFVARSHQLAMGGYASYFDGPGPRGYRLITVWSAPNYSYRSGNKAAILGIRIDAGERHLVVFDAAPEEIRIRPPPEEMPASAQYFA